MQTFGNIVFSFTALFLWYRTRRASLATGRPTPFPKTPRFKIFVIAIVVSDLTIIIRSIYRVIEFSLGWTGYLNRHEPYFYVFDTSLMIICLFIWLIGHPGLTLGTKLGRSNLRGT